MAEDRGGLQYSIQITAEGLQGIQALKAEIQELKAALDSLKSARAGLQSRQAEASVRKETEETRLQTAASESLIRARRRQASETKTLTSQELTSLKRFTEERVDLEINAEKLIAKAKERTAVANQKLEEKRKREEFKRLKEGIIQESKKKEAAEKAGKEERAERTRRLKDFFSLNRALDRTNTAANRISFTFRRLFGILAAFTAARLLVQQFGAAIREMIDFNRRLEIGRLGVAALIVATNEVRDATGGVVDKTQQLVLAQREARRQLDLLRRDSLKTSATFQELLEAFQIGLAPGFRAGLNLDEIRKFSIRISQAATALGLSQNQLSEEIRSIFGGTIQQRTTRIAAALGITNEDIRRAKEAGTLVEFLDEKFSAFEVAGEEAFNTFEGVISRVRDGISLLLGAGGLEFFESLKGLLKDIFDSIAGKDPISGVIEPRPEAVRAVKEIGDAFSEGVRQAQLFAQELGGVQGIAQTVGATLRFVFTGTRAFLSGFIQGFRLVVDMGRKLIAVIKNIPIIGRLFDDVNLEDTIFLLGKISAILVGISILTSAMKAPFVVISNALGAIKILLGPINAAIATMNLLWKGISGTIAAVRVALFSVSTVVGGISAATASTIGGLIVIVALLARALALLNDIDRLRKESKGNNKLLDQMDSVLEKIRSVEKDIRLLEERPELAPPGDIEGLEEKLQALKNLSREINREILSNVGKRTGFLDNILGEIRDISKSIFSEISNNTETLTKTLLPDVIENIDDAASSGQKLSDIFRELPGIVTNALTDLDRQDDVIKGLTEDTQRASDALREAIATRRLSGGIEQQIAAALNSEVALREKSKSLVIEERNLAQQRIGIEAQREKLNAAIARLSEEDQKRVEDGVQAGEDALAFERERDRLTRAIAVNRSRLASATEEERAKLEEIIIENESTVNLLKELLDSRLSLADSLTSGLKNEKELNRIIASRLTLDGQDLALKEQSRKITKDQLELENRINVIRSLNLQRLARINQTALVDEINRLDADRARQAAQIESERLQITQRRILLAQVESEIASRDLQILKDKVAREEQSLENAIEQTRQALSQALKEKEIVEDKEDIERIENAIAVHSETIEALETQRALLGERNRQALELQTIEVEKQARVLEEARGAAEKPVQFGFLLGLREFVTQAPDLFQAVLNATRRGVEDFSGFLADSISSAFDPTSNTSLRESFGRFLLNFANQFLNQIFQVMLANFLVSIGLVQVPLQTAGATLLTAAGPLSSAGFILDAAATKLIVAANLLSASRIGGLGFNKGGNVGAAFMKAGGYAGGGVPSTSVPRSLRPSGLNPRDTVAAWLDPSEWVIRGRSVAKYGADVMDRINRGLIDPTSLRALAGVALSRRGVRSRSRSGGLAEGGAAFTVRPSRSALGFIPAVVVPSEESYRRLARGGSRAFLEEARRHGLLNQ